MTDVGIAVSRDVAEAALGPHRQLLFNMWLRDQTWTAHVEGMDDYGFPITETMKFEDGRWRTMPRPPCFAEVYHDFDDGYGYFEAERARRGKPQDNEAAVAVLNALVTFPNKYVAEPARALREHSCSERRCQHSGNMERFERDLNLEWCHLTRDFSDASFDSEFGWIRLESRGDRRLHLETTETGRKASALAAWGASVSANMAAGLEARTPGLTAARKRELRDADRPHRPGARRRRAKARR